MSASITISFAGSALGDLEEILDYYREQHAPGGDEKLVADIIRDIELLIDQPDMGRIVPEFALQNPRELIRPPFRIVYRREPGKVRIVRIWRSERLMALP